MALGLGLIGTAASRAADDAPTRKNGDRLAQLETPAKGDGFQIVEWDSLMPAGWDPMQNINVLHLGMMRDGDPRTQAALDKLKAAWNQAPVCPEMNGKRVRIAGFVVPIDGTPRQLTEFLLVPYFGACIHVPPPPANQIIHVTAAPPLRGVRMMDAIWVNGTLHTAINDTSMGTSGYSMDAVASAPYVEPTQRR